MSDLPVNQMLCGHNLDVMRQWSDGCIDVCVTSPPYYGLRDYGIPPVDWPEVSFSPMPGLPPMAIPAESSVHGLEKNLWAYVAHEVLIFREVRSLLADHGLLFLNLGDSYTSGGRDSNGNRVGYKQQNNRGTMEAKGRRLPLSPGLKPKELCCVPWRVALALQADGWYLRSACPWLKRNPMPESSEDRPTTAVEYVFILAKCQKYFWDGVAIELPMAQNVKKRQERAEKCTRHRHNSDWFWESWQGMLMDGDGGPLAFIVNPQGIKESHFAVFTPNLVEPMIRAGCPKKVCVKCGKPRERILERTRRATRPGESSKVKTIGPNSRMLKNHDPAHDEDSNRSNQCDSSVVGNRDPERHVTESKTVGWTDCGCAAGFRAGIVLDPFGGSGTVGYVAAKLKRDYVLIDANPKYVNDIASYRLQEAEEGVSVEEVRAGQMSLFGENP